VQCVVCGPKARARRGSLTCSARHAATLQKWARRHRADRDVVFEGAIADGICPVCEEPLLVDVDNGQVRYHVKCAKIARNLAAAGAPY
jgi:2-methylisocitrate lyase-like PEP mutase family enzyme